jgi:hypothetical protein
VRRAAKPKAIDVLTHAVLRRVDAEGAHSRDQQVVVMDALGA